MSVDSCGTCRFWKTGLPDTCHRNPPQVLFVDNTTGDRIFSRWPMADEDEWCGEFEGLPSGDGQLSSEELAIRRATIRSGEMGGWT